MTRKNIVATLVVVGLTALGTAGTMGEASAASWRTCNGSSVKWRGTLNIVRNRCSIGDTGNVNSAYWNGMRQWDRLSNLVDGTFVNPASDCWISHGDGQNEVGLVNRSAIDGANGLTVLQLGLCFIGSNDIDEADVMVANDLGFTRPWGNSLGTVGRSTFVHEFGHLYGFLHESAHTVLRTSPPHLITGDDEPSTVWPSDTIGMNALYGFAANRANLIPSALGVVGGAAATLDPAGIINVCRGSARSTRVYLGNSGNTGSGTYGLRVRLSTTSPTAGYNLGSTVVSSFTHSLGAFSQGTFDLGFTVPNNLPNGIYFIYVDMDSAGAIPEILNGDNTTVSARRLRVNC